MEGTSSVVIPLSIYIYVDDESHNLLKEHFGESLQNEDVSDLLQYLYNEHEHLITFNPPTYAFPVDESYYNHLPVTDGKLILSVTTDTGAQNYSVIDYAMKDWYEVIRDNL